MYDIAIIGAGPAGAILARELKRRLPDFKIAIADGLSEGQSKVCGGLLSPDAKKELSSLGIEIPDSCADIEMCAFLCCFSLEWAKLSNNVSILSESLFYSGRESCWKWNNE